MAAYGVLVSVMHIIEQIQDHPRPPISLDKKQVESLTKNVIFLQEFLEGYSHGGGSEEADAFENRIADAAHAAEDVIESHIVDQIHAGSTSSDGGNISSIDFYQGLQEVIETMDLIKKEVLEIKETLGIQHQLHGHSMAAGSFKSPPTGLNNIVGFDDVLEKIMDMLIGHESDRQIIPIVGMGGIGKTTLARNIYVNLRKGKHFDILAWVTISQNFSVREFLIDLLLCVKTEECRENLSQISEEKLQIMLHKSLSWRRYLIILDDIWSIEAWEKVNFFPDNNNGSRIIITTRLSNVAFQLTDSGGIKMDFLDDDKSWHLLCKNVFGDECFPIELEGIGKKIAKNCKGLPLSITVIGGLLANSERTQEYWKYIAENLSSIVNLEDDERCLKILHTSYNQLPVHLKPCFLYMGAFPEDYVIHVSSLIKLWVAEGFLKPISGKSLEVVAEEYLKDLTDRNLILIRKRRYNGKIKLCAIHDLLRDICLREAEKKKFLCIIRQNIPQGINTQRRIGVHQPKVFDALQSASLARSLICRDDGYSLPFHNFKLMRVFNSLDTYKHLTDEFSLEASFQLVNWRYISVTSYWNVPLLRIPCSVDRLWNLQTLIVGGGSLVTAPPEIWKMPLLRHVEFRFGIHLPDPPSGHSDGRDDFVLGNLQTMSDVMNFKCGEELVKRIPNIKILRICYDKFEEWSHYSLNNLSHLHKLESLGCFFYPKGKLCRSELLQNLNFPHSLKKLSLYGSRLHWEDMATMIGSLPLLQVLRLYGKSFIGPEWETVEGQFCSLKYLLIDRCDELQCWTTDSSHFPCLEHLVLQDLYKLKEIPWGIGEIPTLQSIQLEDCTDSAIISAKAILEEQEELENVGLQVRVRLSRLSRNKEELQGLASRNFIFER